MKNSSEYYYLKYKKERYNVSELFYSQLVTVFILFELRISVAEDRKLLFKTTTTTKKESLIMHQKS